MCVATLAGRQRPLTVCIAVEPYAPVLPDGGRLAANVPFLGHEAHSAHHARLSLPDVADRALADEQVVIHVVPLLVGQGRGHDGRAEGAQRARGDLVDCIFVVKVEADVCINALVSVKGQQRAGYR